MFREKEEHELAYMRGHHTVKKLTSEWLELKCWVRKGMTFGEGRAECSYRGNEW